MYDSRRQLAAIMFTDIVGYTALMGKDANKALELVHQSKQIQMPLVEKHSGIWLKEMGDGAMAQFGSAIDAVSCAIEIQHTSHASFDAEFRIGIHLGDITLENQDVYGDGVNVAARLESIADPGGIYISNSVEKAIRGQANIQTSLVGEVKFKNVEYDVKVFAVQGNNLTVLTKQRINELAIAAKKRVFHKSPWFYIVLLFLIVLSVWSTNYFLEKKEGDPITSLAVLPFQNFTEDSTQNNFINGIQDNLITELSQISALDVISRTSTIKYKNTKLSIPQIAKELEVDAIIEASVLRSTDSIRINVQLIRAFPTEKHVWADIFDVPMVNILFLFDDITKSISSQIGKTIMNDDPDRKLKVRPINPDAFKAYVTGNIYAEQLSAEGFHTAIRHYERSITIDSNYAPAYAGIAFAWIVGAQMRYVSKAEAIPKIYGYNQKALDLDVNYPYAQYVKALISLQGEWDWHKSEKAFKKALEANPNHALAHAHYSHLLLYLKRFDEAMSEAQKAVKLGPNNSFLLSLYGVILWHTGLIDSAIVVSKRSYELNPFNTLTFKILESTSFLKGNYSESIAMTKKLYQEELSSFEVGQEEFSKTAYEAEMAKLAGILEAKAQTHALHISLYYNRAGMYEKAIEWLEKGHEFHDVDMPYAFLPTEMNTLRLDPRYREIASKMNLPF